MTQTAAPAVTVVRDEDGRKRYVASCPKCDYKVERSTKSAALHIVGQHIGYEMCRPKATA